jgi:mannose-1-phosphate guanylyltransferase/mannose-6-phosphate isomerase
MIALTPVILCGGSGTRLWPLSRADYPKQFIKLNDKFTLFQKTIRRVKLLANQRYKVDEIIIVTNESHRFLVLEQLKQVNINIKIKIILEPCSLNTAPALTLAATASSSSILIVMPTDQYIEKDNIFIECVQKSIESIKDNQIFIFGVKPKSIEDSYGYIVFERNSKIKTVSEFIEKPKKQIAKRMITNNKCLWNLGVFVLNNKTWLDAIYKADKSIFLNVTKSWRKKKVDNEFIRPCNSDYSKASSKSIDYAVIEKAISMGIDLKAIEMKTNWSDIGQHKALDILFKKNSKKNILQGDVVEQNAENTTVMSSGRQISLLGVRDLIIIDTKDSLLVVNKNSPASMRDLIKKISKNNKEILHEHSVVHRPWGLYELILKQDYCKIKRIVVNPCSQLSYQTHKYRSEHWIVLKGIATIKKNGRLFKLSKNESTYISSGDKHKLMNNEKDVLEIIEVQTGKRLSEDDIIRYDDMYGRTSKKLK